MALLVASPSVIVVSDVWTIALLETIVGRRFFIRKPRSDGHGTDCLALQEGAVERANKFSFRRHALLVSGMLARIPRTTSMVPSRRKGRHKARIRDSALPGKCLGLGVHHLSRRHLADCCSRRGESVRLYEELATWRIAWWPKSTAPLLDFIVYRPLCLPPRQFLVGAALVLDLTADLATADVHARAQRDAPFAHRRLAVLDARGIVRFQNQGLVARRGHPNQLKRSRWPEVWLKVRGHHSALKSAFCLQLRRAL